MRLAARTDGYHNLCAILFYYQKLIKLNIKPKMIIRFAAQRAGYYNLSILYKYYLFLSSQLRDDQIVKNFAHAFGYKKIL